MEDNNKKHFDDKYFSVEGNFNLDFVMQNLETLIKSKDSMPPFEYLTTVWEFTKYFKECGAGLNIAFKDICDKVNICRNNLNFFNDCKTLQDIMELEKSLGIAELNSENNSKKGFKKGDKFFKYESSII